MQAPRITKVTVNIGVGEPGEPLQRAEKLLQDLLEQKPMRTFARSTLLEFGVKKHAPIGAKVTLRGEKAERFFKSALEAVEFTLKERQIDQNGNVAFGVKEYIELPNIKYDPDVGMSGMDVCATIERSGFRIARRKHSMHKIPKRQRVTPKETLQLLTEKYSVKVES